MKKNVFDGLDTKVSRLGFGCMRFPTTEDGKIDRKQSLEMIEYAYENGTTYFDTAWGYHEEESQYFMGEALKQYPRDSFYLATKMPSFLLRDDGMTPEEIFTEQLKRCQVEYFDYYLLHAMNGPNFEIMENAGAYEYLQEQKKNGKLHYLGFSFHGDMESLHYMLDNYDWDFVQLQINYFDHAYLMSSADEEYQLVTSHGLPVIVMEPVRGGFLAKPPVKVQEKMKAFDPNTSPASWALQWCLNHDNMKLILSGMSAMEHVKDNIDTFANFEPLTPAEEALIAESAETILSVDTVPCTACRYCMDCSFGVDIPEAFRIYNDCQIFENIPGALRRYNRLVEKEKDYDQCTQCQVCVPECPQNIMIPDELERLGEFFKALQAKHPLEKE